jgi:hypothetical protein
MPFIYLKIFIVNKPWYLGAILQKLVILKATQNFKNLTFNNGDFPFLNQIFFFIQRIQLKVLYKFIKLDFSNFNKIHDFGAHLQRLVQLLYGDCFGQMSIKG